RRTTQTKTRLTIQEKRCPEIPLAETTTPRIERPLRSCSSVEVVAPRECYNEWLAAQQLTKKAGSPMRVIYAQEPFPEEITCTVFLLGPTPRKGHGGTDSWRTEALHLLEKLHFTGEVFVPEPRDGRWADDYTDQVAWEEQAMHRSDRILV